MEGGASQGGCHSGESPDGGHISGTWEESDWETCAVRCSHARSSPAPGSNPYLNLSGTMVEHQHRSLCLLAMFLLVLVHEVFEAMYLSFHDAQGV